MKISKSFYGNRWADRKNGDFLGYERNRALSEFFPVARDKKLLDPACGNGKISHFFAKRGYKVWGIDISKNAILASKRLNIGKFRVRDLNEGLPYITSFFDIIFWGDGIEHVFDPEGILKEARRVVKTGGRIVISTPNMSFWIYRWHYFKTGVIPHTAGHQTETWSTGHIHFLTYINL